MRVGSVAAASLLIASRGVASPQKFEKRVLTIFRLEPDPYESAHQLDCSFLFPTAIATESKAAQFPVIKSNNNKLQRRLIVNTVSETQQKHTKGILAAQLKLPRQTSSD